MCRADGNDPCDVYDAKWRKAAKQHRCEECRREIHVGERYEYVTGLYDGHWFSAKTCVHCVEARHWLNVVCGGWLHTEVLDELVEHWYENWVYHSLAFGRVIVWMRRQWADLSTEQIAGWVNQSLFAIQRLELESMRKVIERRGFTLTIELCHRKPYRIDHPEWGSFRLGGTCDSFTLERKLARREADHAWEQRRAAGRRARRRLRPSNGTARRSWRGNAEQTHRAGHHHAW